jgi:hypothetical protein
MPRFHEIISDLPYLRVVGQSLDDLSTRQLKKEAPVQLDVGYLTEVFFDNLSMAI